MPLDDIIFLTAGALIIGWVLYKFCKVFSDVSAC